MSERIVLIDNSIVEEVALKAIIELLNFNAENDKEPIYLYINSPGGSIDHGLAIYDTMKHISAPVYTVCIGLAASMGSFLLSCGEKGHRAALKHSKILIHQPLIRANGSYRDKESEIRKMAEGLRKCRDTLESIMAENTSQPIEKIHQDCERDNWLTPQEALAYGLIDEII